MILKWLTFRSSTELFQGVDIDRMIAFPPGGAIHNRLRLGISYQPCNEISNDMKSAPDPLLDRILAWSLDRPLAVPYRYLATTGLIVAIALVRALLITGLLPWLLFIPAIVGVSLIFGQRVGIYASVLSGAVAGITIGNVGEPWFLTRAQWGGSLLFVIIATLLARVIGELRLVFRSARRLNVELMERQAFLSGVLTSSTDCIKVIDLDGRLTFMTEGGMKVMEISDFNDVKGCPWPDFWQDEGNAEARRAIESARNGISSHFIGKADTFIGTPKWWDVSVSPIMGPDGKPDRILSVSRDTTELMEAQNQQRLLNGELGHRLKNVLALVQSIANQTFRQADTLADANAAFSARLAALGKATDILTSTTWQSASFDDVIRAGITSIDGMDDRIEVNGPPMKLESQVALAMTLALHELSTNACKYGALSNDSGRISLTWDVEAVENEEPMRFNFKWQETGRPPVTPPTRKGFGSRMIERSLSSYFRGKTALDYDPAGVIFTIDAPLPKVGLSVR